MCIYVGQDRLIFASIEIVPVPAPVPVHVETVKRRQFQGIVTYYLINMALSSSFQYNIDTGVEKMDVEEIGYEVRRPKP